MIETGNLISRRYQLQAQTIAKRLPQVLQRRGLEAPFTEFLLTSTQGMVLLFAILDLPKSSGWKPTPRPSCCTT